LVTLEDLAIEERAGAGWCVRLGMPEPIAFQVGLLNGPEDPPDTGYNIQELLVEFTVTTGGTAYTFEANAFPDCSVHIAGEQISARLKWATSPVWLPPNASLRWQVTRGTCQTKAVRAFDVQAPVMGNVPAFATGFAVFSGDADISENIQLDFATHPGATRLIQHYTKEDLLQVVSAFCPVPPGAAEWRWLTATAEPARLVFSLGDSL
jgi:hypothetical protein